MEENEHYIDYPLFIADHPRKYQDETITLREEGFYYNEVLHCLGNEDAALNENCNDGKSTGVFNIWYKNKDDGKITYEKILSYKDILKSGLGPGGLKHFIEYFYRYFNMFKGEVIQIIYNHPDITWSYKDGKYFKADLSDDNKFYKWV